MEGKEGVEESGGVRNVGDTGGNEGRREEIMLEKREGEKGRGGRERRGSEGKGERKGCGKLL